MSPQPIEIEIRDVAFGGKGVGGEGGKAVFVPFTMTGERVRATITREKKKFAEATLEEVVTPSPRRVEPPCPYFGTCGGCSYQHIEYEAQVELKSAQVEQALRRIGRMRKVPMKPGVGSPQPYGYRNRIRVHVADGKSGFYGTDGRTLIDVERCWIASEEVNQRLTKLRSSRLSPGDYTVRQRNATPYFSQTNPVVADRLRELVAASIGQGGLILIDAYAGSGFFARALRRGFEQVIGIEENGEAVAAARQQAKAHERYLEGPVEDHLGRVFEDAGEAEVVLVLDPPAIGLSPRVLDRIVARAPEQVIYVSCNPATLARDLGALTKVLELISVTPVDMFPQTAEIEVVAVLRGEGRRERKTDL